MSNPNYYTQQKENIKIEEYEEYKEIFCLRAQNDAYPHIQDDMVIGPNVFNPWNGGQTNIIYTLKNPTDVAIKIFTIAGDLIKEYNLLINLLEPMKLNGMAEKLTQDHLWHQVFILLSLKQKRQENYKK